LKFATAYRAEFTLTRRLRLAAAAGAAPGQ
jgi:hypothetical protein